MSNYFKTLNEINVNEHTEKKNGLTYLSWAWAWGEIKKIHPDAVYTIYENNNGWNYFTDGKTCWVKTGVTVNNIEHIEYLPVMDYKNKSISADNVTSFDVNKTIQRSLTKACARHGLGLYIYAGEDLPETDNEAIQAFEKEATQDKRAKTTAYKKGEEVKSDKSIEVRYQEALKYTSSLTKEEFKSKRNSILDKLNDLLRELKDKGCSGYYNNLMMEYNRLAAIDDRIPY